MEIPKEFLRPNIIISYSNRLRIFGPSFLIFCLYYYFIKCTAFVLYGKQSQIIFAKLAWHK